MTDTLYNEVINTIEQLNTTNQKIIKLVKSLEKRDNQSNLDGIYAEMTIYHLPEFQKEIEYLVNQFLRPEAWESRENTVDQELTNDKRIITVAKIKGASDNEHFCQTCMTLAQKLPQIFREADILANLSLVDSKGKKLHIL